MNAWTFPVALAVALVAFVGFLTVKPLSGAPVTAVFPISYASTDALQAALQTDAADLTIVRTGPMANLVTVHSPDPNLLQALSDAGALLTLNGSMLGLCSGAGAPSRTGFHNPG